VQLHFRLMYEDPIHPANLWLNHDPGQHAEVDAVYRDNIHKLVKRGSYTLPAESFPGVRYIPPGDGQESDWSSVRQLWSDVDSSEPAVTTTVSP
jgi:beta-ureidopropionase